MTDKQQKKQAYTTLRAKVTPEEHEAVRWVAKVRYNYTLDEFIRLAIDAYLESQTGSGLAKHAEKATTRGKIVQEELF